VKTDSSNFAIGTILSQASQKGNKIQTIEFFSRSSELFKTFNVKQQTNKKNKKNLQLNIVLKFQILNMMIKCGSIVQSKFIIEIKN